MRFYVMSDCAAGCGSADGGAAAWFVVDRAQGRIVSRAFKTQRAAEDYAADLNCAGVVIGLGVLL